MLLNREALSLKIELCYFQLILTTCLLCVFFSFFTIMAVYYKTLRPKSRKQLPGLALLLILYGAVALVENICTVEEVDAIY